MAGLVAYESSDEEEDVKSPPVPEPLPKLEATTADANSAPDTQSQGTAQKKSTQQPEAKPDDAAAEEPAAAVYGPQLGGSTSEAVNFPPLEGAEEAEETDPTSIASALPQPPGSPYTATRALLRDLTLPSAPDLAIPPSPPGSPSAATGRKLEGFLDLKRKKGVHFNARLAETAAMRNPALADKLLAFAELDHRDQYRTVSIRDDDDGEGGESVLLWDPDAFPRYAYKEQLRQSQTDIAQARARATGEPVKFVAAAESAAATATTAGGGGGGGGDGEDGRSTTLVTGTGKRKSRFDT